MQGNQQLSDVFNTMYILSNTLMAGQPLPAYLPKLRDRLIYHESHTGRRSMNPSLIKSMFSRTGASDVKGMEKGQATDMDQPSQASRGGNPPPTGPTAVDGSSIGIELDELTLDVLLVSMHFAPSAIEPGWLISF